MKKSLLCLIAIASFGAIAQELPPVIGQSWDSERGLSEYHQRHPMPDRNIDYERDYSYRVKKPNSCANIKIHSSYPVEEYQHYNEIWIEGRLNKEYSIEVRNNCPFNVMAITSVDGINTLNGERANYNQPGYIVKSGSSIVINGWQKSKNKTAAFYFTYPEKSYSEKRNMPDNLGVLGVAFFKEKQRFENYEMENSVPSPSMNMRGKSADLGTGWGRERENPVRAVEFDRESRPFYVKEIRYDTYKKLIANGVIDEKPKAFDNFQYAPSPR